MENRKVILSSYLSASVVSWFLCRSLVQWAYTTFYHIRRLPGIDFGREALPVLVGAIVFIGLFKNPKVNLVMEEVVSELKKVTWPNREDVMKSTWVVLVCILIASFILAGFDLMWGKLIGALLKG